MTIETISGRFSVGVRIYAGFIVVLVLLVAVSGIGIRGLADAMDGHLAFAHIGGDALFAEQVRGDVANLRRSVVFFTERGEGEEEVRQRLNTLRPQIASILSAANTAGERANAERMSALFNSYAADFDTLAQMRKQRDALVGGTLDPLSHQMRVSLTEIVSNALAEGKFENAARAGLAQEALMQARYKAAKFLAAPDQKLADAVKVDLDHLTRLIDDLLPRLVIPANIARLRQMIDDAGRFGAAFDQVRGIAVDLDALVYRSMVGKAKEFNDLADANGQELARAEQAIATATEGEVRLSILFTLCFSGIAVLIGCLFAWLIARSIIRPVAGVRQVMADLSAGHLDVKVPYTEGRDELAEMARTVEVFKEVSVAAVRAASGLDRVSANVMMADSAGVITYVNPSLIQMFRVAEGDIRSVMAGFDHASLVGRRFDEFHAHKDHNRRLIDGLTGTHQATIKVGPRVFRLIANPVLSKLGVRLGTVVEWQDMTSELVIEDEIKGIIAGAAKGDLSRRIALGGKDGFFRAVSEGINNLAQTVSDVSGQLAAMLNALANGDLTRRIDQHYDGVFQQLKGDYNTTADRLAEIVGRIGDATEAISQAAAEVSSGSAHLAERTEQQASSLEQTAASMEQLGATVRTSAGNAQRAAKMAGDARNAAENGGQVTGSAIEAIKQIADASRKITEIIGVMDEIAFQTNLLALNAAVEAARAGDAGKGFAVVAQEVRVLAQRSAQASKEIKTLILNSDNQVKSGVAMVMKAGESLSGIVRAVHEVAALISEIAAASAEQATALDQVNVAVAAMDQMTQKNAALVEETRPVAEAMADQASGLREQVAFFTVSSGGGRNLPDHPPARSDGRRKLRNG